MWESEISLHISFIGLNPRLMTKYKKTAFCISAPDVWSCGVAGLHNVIDHCISVVDEVSKYVNLKWQMVEK